MNKKFLDIAEAHKPRLCETLVFPNEPECGKALKSGDSVVFDFGNHFVGYVSLRLGYQGSHPDAPALISLHFCEVARELDADTDNYSGWLSASWIQEERIHADTLPSTVHLTRRFAFRYVKLEVIAVSSKYSLTVEDISAVAVSSVSEENTKLSYDGSSNENRIYQVALRTLKNCMQYEFEDGPKRDRRLWLGDLRLQALANYGTYKHYDLVKRCLYLFAGTADDNGSISACVFTSPEIAPDNTFMFDYSLLFIPTLLDYYVATGDKATAADLLPLALKQLELAREHFDTDHLVINSDVLGWCFLDWNLELDKQAGAQAVYIYAAKAAAKLCSQLGIDNSEILVDIQEKQQAAIEKLYDHEIGLFVSGEERQISYASNVWFVLSGIFNREQAATLIEYLECCSSAVRPVTPYMMHYYIEALISCGRKKKAYNTMMDYWGGMVKDGADTFYELYNPENPDESPYGSSVVNSFCHAWSCTPVYFLNGFFKERSNEI